jgi:hypothetical protein
MARRPPKKASTRLPKPNLSRAPADLATARFRQLHSKWHDLQPEEVRRELRRIIGELRLYRFRNKAGPLDQSLPFIELAALAASASD